MSTHEITPKVVIPATARRPRDHQKPQKSQKSAVQIEAEQFETVQVEYAGNTYTFPASLDEASGDVLDAIDEEKISRALKGLLEGGEWERFKKTKPRVRDYAGLFSVFAEAIGLETVGE